MTKGWLAAAAGCLLLAHANVRAAADRSLVLSEEGWWRQCCRFAADRVSADILKREGAQLLGPTCLQRIRKQTEDRLRQAGVDPSRVDWRDHVLVRMFFENTLPDAAPPPPDDWMMPGFDDSSWVFERGFFHQPPTHGQPLPKGPGWTQDTLDQEAFSSLGMQSCCYRARFVVSDPGKVGDLTLRLAYRGGARAFLNGTEVARGHLPDGRPDTPAEEYPRDAYGDRPGLRDLVLGPVKIPPGLLRKGTNLLAVEVRASRLHPVVLSMKLALHNHKVRQGMVGLWRHCGLLKLELRSESQAVASALSRPPGVQVWVQDPNRRVDSLEFLPPGEPVGIVRFVGARNGTYGAQVVVGTAKALDGLRVKPTDLTQAGGGGRIPALAVHVLHLAPYPAAEFRETKLGDDRGLGGTFPDPQVLARYEGMAEPLRPHIFDHLISTPPRSIPANTCRPVWLSLRIPADALPGTYRGAVEVSAEGVAPIRLPIEAEVVGWRLPDARDFQTFVGCEQNPYGVVKQYGVPLWSDAHFKLLEASFRQLGRLGNKWLNVPVIARTEFGNRDDSMIRWRRGKDGALAFDYAILDRYLDLAAKHCGSPRVVNFVVMQGMKSAADPP
ncbi:MAG TPA: glycoside hydrolase domain-containing protein, partial [Planctomycetota bacterium]|nr:glycoside hydrolase domain-containing protein [Planctomycetota bacterium]